MPSTRTTLTPEEQARLEELVSVALELRDDGRSDWLEVACAEHPEFLADVRAAVESAARVESVFDTWSASDPRVGSVLAGRYKLEQRLGSGAMGVVFRARDLELGRQVAIKVLRPGFGDPDETSARFEREAAAMASTRHRAVVTIHDRGRLDDGEMFIVMELLEGASLADLLDEARRARGGTRSDDADWIRSVFGVEVPAGASYIRTVVGWTAELASGLEALHGAGVLHRDLKPSNVFVRRNAEPVLLDFGIAALDGRAALTREGSSVGTPSYMAPEALSAGTPPRPSLDVYGLTATLYHLLTLQTPYQGSVSQVLAAIATRDPEPAERLRPGLPRDLQAIVDKGMNRSPKGRYASAAALEADLRAFLDYRPVEARPIGPVKRVLRRVARSAAARGGLAVIVVGLALFGAASLRAHFDGQRAERYNWATQRFPPNFPVVKPENRVWRSAADRAALAALLDTAVENATEPIPSRVLRASFRLDHGDQAGAAADMRRVAADLGTSYAQALADRYTHATAGVGDSSAVSLADLPAPVTAEDKYLAGYHLMRAGDHAGARELFGLADVRRIPHAEELWIITQGFGGMTTRQQREVANERTQEILQLEAREGQRTAGTAHVLGRMLLAQDRYVEARRVIRDGIALAPRSYPLRLNAGLVAWRLRLVDEARQHWDVATDLAPNDYKVHQHLIWLALDAGDTDEAERLLACAPFGSDDAGRQLRLLRQAEIASNRAVRARQDRDEAAVRAQAQQVLTCLAEAARLGPVPLNEHEAIAKGLLDENGSKLFEGLLRSLLEDPERLQRLGLLIDHMPDKIDAVSTRLLRQYLASLFERLTTRQLPSFD